MGTEAFRPRQANRFRQAIQALPRTVLEVRRTVGMLSSLRGLGWFDSVRCGAPVDPNGDPLPWLSYAAIVWLEPRVRPADRVFEFGAGHSTLWFARLVDRVDSVEHDGRWVDRLRQMLPSNAHVEHRPCAGSDVRVSLEDPYVQAIARFDDESFDVIVVDGMARNTCVQTAVSKLKPSGILILDNADRPQYAPAIEGLHDLGFSRIDFFGPLAAYGVFCVTSVFLRDSQRWLGKSPPPIYLGG